MAVHTVAVSVRQLVESILRSGDIDTVSGMAMQLEAMQQGGKLHRRLQKEAGSSYVAEVNLTHTIWVDDELVITVSGRADGVITENELAADEDGVLIMQSSVTIDEIKSTYRDLRRIDEPVPTHMAQALCYAYFYCEREGLDFIWVRITYAHLGSDKVKYFTEKKSYEELKRWYEELIASFAKWVKWSISWKKQRDESIASCVFPFEYRRGQRELISGVYQTIVRNKRLFVQAPTGTGKTISTIYPSIKALGAGQAERIFYMTARTIARTVAEDTFAQLDKAGLCMKIITLTAREKICVLDEAICAPTYCPRAKGHYDRVNDALYDMITHESAMDRACIEEYANKYQLCPFELQLDAALMADAVICDYNYVFDPDIALKRFFVERSGEYIFLIDEAHNLVDRAREMYGAVISLSALTVIQKELRGSKIDRKISTALRKLIKQLKSLEDEAGEEPVFIDSKEMDTILSISKKLIQHMEECLKHERRWEIRRLIMELYFILRAFRNAWERSDDRYYVFGIKEAGDYQINIMCMDPSKDLGERLAKGCASVFFSATLLPVTYYKEMLSDSGADDYDMYVDSPFDPNNCLILMADDVSSKYSRRSVGEYEKMASYIRDVIRSKHGNYMVFFPSYEMMGAVADIFLGEELSKVGHGLRVVMQESEMSEEEREGFLDAFKEETMESVIGFCVMGGIFSEGIDLKADRLIGAIIVGTGLPGISVTRELIKRYFDEKGRKGFDYAYLYPGMNKVLQAGGRVIRTEADTGVILLLDERFAYSQYRRIMPREWKHITKTRLGNVKEDVENFWTSK